MPRRRPPRTLAYARAVAGPVTLSQVAREAGVSLATASRAINGSPGRAVRADLRDRVLAAAERLRYSPDANAQAMARGRTTALGLVVPDIADPRVASVAAGVCGAADRAGLTVTLASTARDPSREPRVIEALTRQRARALVVVDARVHDDADADADLGRALDAFRASGGTVAVVGRPRFGVDTVVVDDRAGAAALARALHALGLRRFAVLGGPEDDPAARERRAGFAEALAALGTPVAPGADVACAATSQGGRDGLRRVLAARPDLDAVLAVGDAVAAGAVDAARGAGRRVPDDVAVAGFGDHGALAASPDAGPALSTVHVPMADVGVLATELALTAGADAPRVVRVAGTVVLRGSTPPAAGASS